MNAVLRSAALPWILSGILLALLLIVGRGLAKSQETVVTLRDQRATESHVPAPTTSISTAPSATVTRTVISGETKPGDVVLDPRTIRESPAGIVVRRAALTRKIQRDMGRYLDALSLSSNQKASLSRYLTERAQTIQDTVEVLAKLQVLDQSMRNSAIGDALSKITPSPESFLTNEQSSKLNELILFERQLSEIEGSLALDLAAAGVPLSAEQGLALARHMTQHHVNFVAAGDRRIAQLVGGNPAPPEPNFPAFQSAASLVLSLEQLAVMTSSQNVRQAQDDIAFGVISKALQPKPASSAENSATPKR